MDIKTRFARSIALLEVNRDAEWIEGAIIDTVSDVCSEIDKFDIDESVQPTYNVLHRLPFCTVSDGSRVDNVSKSDLLDNAPVRNDDFFLVQKTIK